MVKMKNVTVGDTISGEVYKGIALMDEQPDSTRMVVDDDKRKYLFDLSDIGETVIILEE